MLREGATIVVLWEILSKKEGAYSNMATDTDGL